ncbi:hypothetical protein NKT34_08920 [Paenibacillus polysaccharolyticus]|uniref:hypothetical protein n=1 Tax=Paenibacillus polysaccharolyticus TaxID=582692 RepID=UPI00209C7972|nr:hypothetical protein [Paenibacillus polysaccharolyticus]MCP1133408.1 hypothetical protein [Paenibacillus polysaccharolyticus]
MSEQLNKISNYIGVFVSGTLILVFFLVAIMATIKMFINIYRKFIGVKVSKIRSCRTCGRSISSTALICPDCGENYGEMHGAENSIITCFIMALFFFALGVGFLAESVGWFERTFLN